MKKFRAKEDFFPFYRKGDEFIILDITTDERLLPVIAERVRDRNIYYFNWEEIRE